MYIQIFVPGSILTILFLSSTVLEPDSTSLPYSGLSEMIT